MGGGIDDQFMQGKADMHGGIRAQMRIDALDAQRRGAIRPIGRELLFG